MSKGTPGHPKIGRDGDSNPRMVNGTKLKLVLPHAGLFGAATLTSVHIQSLGVGATLA
jgi:hypothetical protein